MLDRSRNVEKSWTKTIFMNFDNISCHLKPEISDIFMIYVSANGDCQQPSIYKSHQFFTVPPPVVVMAWCPVTTSRCQAPPFQEIDMNRSSWWFQPIWKILVKFVHSMTLERSRRNSSTFCAESWTFCQTYQTCTANTHSFNQRNLKRLLPIFQTLRSTLDHFPRWGWK